mgnify:CR=1 FL=1
MKENEILIYKSNNGPKVDVRLLNDTVWLTQDQMSTLFKKAKSTINEHIKNIYKERELKESQTLQKFGISEFQKKASNYYNLDVIISVGYRVKSQRGTDFRIWAMTILKQHIVDGYTQNTNRLLERKLEIEINESREIMTKMLTTGSSTKQVRKHMTRLLMTERDLADLTPVQKRATKQQIVSLRCTLSRSQSHTGIVQNAERDTADRSSGGSTGSHGSSSSHDSSRSRKGSGSSGGGGSKEDCAPPAAPLSPAVANAASSNSSSKKKKTRLAQQEPPLDLGDAARDLCLMSVGEAFDDLEHQENSHWESEFSEHARRRRPQPKWNVYTAEDYVSDSGSGQPGASSMSDVGL